MFDIRSSEFNNCRSSDPVGAGVRQHPVVGNLPASKSGRRNSAGAGIRRPEPNSGRIRPDLDGSGHYPAGSGQNGRDPAGSGWVRPLTRPDLAKTAGIRPDPEDSGLNPAILAGSGQTFSPKSGNGDRTLPDSGDNYQTLIFAFRNFFVRTKHRKIFSKKIIFSENDFVEIILRWKSFYVETNGA